MQKIVSKKISWEIDRNKLDEIKINVKASLRRNYQSDMKKWQNLMKKFLAPEDDCFKEGMAIRFGFLCLSHAKRSFTKVKKKI